MALTLNNVVPWGRSYDEYVRMFDLSEADLGCRILGCGDGPAAFNAALTKRGGNIISLDPLYNFDVQQITARIAETYSMVMDQMRGNQNDYVWTNISSAEHLGTIRMSAMETFLTDFVIGKQQGRYVAGELPLLPFANNTFDIALSSHFLFLYSDQLDAEFHLQAVQEMLRVSREVRIFPLLTLNGKLSPHLTFVSGHFSKLGFIVEIKRVHYEFQRGANEMLLIQPA